MTSSGRIVFSSIKSGSYTRFIRSKKCAGIAVA